MASLPCKYYYLLFRKAFPERSTDRVSSLPTRCRRCREVIIHPFHSPNISIDVSSSPLKPEELQVLRAQYEKEGEYVGIQTKFNYAWVLPLCSKLTSTLSNNIQRA
jgi:hypothetical protein